MKTLLPILVILLLSGCGNNSNQSKSQKDSITTTILTKPQNLISKDKFKKGKTKFELLQGKWQSTDDKTNYLVFENNHRKEIAGGMSAWDDEVFTLSDKCTNERNKDNTYDSEKDRYISCAASDLCWYILELDSNTLSLTYMVRGNTLTYHRVK